MIKYTLTNNRQDAYIPVNPTKQNLAFFPTEESQMFFTADPNHDYSSTTLGSTFDSSTYIDRNTITQPTKYVGATGIETPYIIDPTFADFKVVETQPENYGSLASLQSFEDASKSLFPDDSNPKVVTLFNGVQALRIPSNRFNETLTDPQEIQDNNGSDIAEKPGLYLTSVTPKYIETTITEISERTHPDQGSVTGSFNDLESKDGNTLGTNDGGVYYGRRTLYRLSKAAFQSTVWNFENADRQRGRLFGSLVEIWSGDQSTLKQRKFIAESALNLNFNNQDPSVTMYPDNFGFDSPNQTPQLDDVVRIYPRETYFNPIFIQIDYIGSNQDIKSLVDFMKNDAARDINNGVYEIYDENGIIIADDGSLDGKVVQSYQIERQGDKEVRRNIPLKDQQENNFTFVKTWRFDNNNWFSGNAGFISELEHDFQVGDVIKIEQDPGFTNPEYNTTTVIRQIPDATTIVTDIPWAGDTGKEGGVVIKIG